MDEFLSEREQIDRLRQWWRENGWFIIGGAALGALFLFGLGQYRAHQARQAEDASALYQQMKQAADANNLTEADRILAQLRSDFAQSAYTHQAGLLAAESVLVSDPERAARELRQVMETSEDREMSMIARLRLARVLAYREQYQEALQVLAADNLGQFAGRFAEVKGDIYVALGDEAQARTAYLQAMTAPGAEVLDRSFLQMKLNELLANVPPPEGSTLPPVDPAAPVQSAPAEPGAADTAPPPAEEGA